MRLDSRRVKNVSWVLILSYCLACKTGDRNAASFRELTCTDMNQVARPCGEVLSNSRVLVFSPFCPTCCDVIRKLDLRSNIVGVSPQSLPYLRYYQLKIPIRFPIFKVRTGDLRRLGIESVPCLLTTDQDGAVIDLENQITLILTELGASKD